VDNVLDWHRRALDEFGRRVHAVADDQWVCQTPCTDWQVRALVNHLVVEQLWVPAMLDGATIGEVGDRFDGDQLGDDPVAAWDVAAKAAADAFAADGALDRTVHLSYGDRPAREYCLEMTFDLIVHAWDLARAIGADEQLDAELVEMAYAQVEPQVDAMAASGLFAEPVPVPDDADPQTRLIAITGRDPDAAP
jgi:uncharacterized protein (TIGR03086 family)